MEPVLEINHMDTYVFGVEDRSHQILGTSFTAETAKKGNEDLENWIHALTSL